VTAKLIHVGVVESTARRYLVGEQPPEWFENKENLGMFSMKRWAENQVMAMLTARMAGEEHAVNVQVGALYEFLDEKPPS
jgi:hypothetical protein